MDLRRFLGCVRRRPWDPPLPEGWVLPHWLERQLDPDDAHHRGWGRQGPEAERSGPQPHADSTLGTSGGPGIRALTSPTSRGWPANVSGRSWTRLGVLDGGAAALVDARGLVTTAEGWSLDWWIGSEQRWHLPSREVGVRQSLLDGVPAVETRLRVPSGDAVHRVAAAGSPADEIVVVEVENDSAVPVALAVSVRPYGMDGPARIDRVELSSSTVSVNGRTALRCPKPPGASVAHAAADGDVSTVVLAGAATGRFEGEVRCPDGLAQAALVFPLAHRASLRFVLGRSEQAAPTVAQVASGWRAHRERGARVELPDVRLAAAVAANRCHLLSSRDGARGAVDDATIVAALDDHGYGGEAAELLAETASDEPAWAWALDRHLARDGDPERFADVVEIAAGVGRHAARLGADGGGGAAWCAAGARAAARLLDRYGDQRGARDAARLADRVVLADDDDCLLTACRLGVLDPADARVGAALDRADPGDAPGAVADHARVELLARPTRAFERLTWLLDIASPTWSWSSAGDGHDLAVAARVLSLVRDLLVREDGEGLVLAPLVPDTWLGQGWEVHDAPTRFGRFGYAVRWHDERPALLWDLAGKHGRDVRISAPGLDPGWSTTEARGEALLAPAASRHDAGRASR